ncbi:9178_t:CDS:2, partial [Racocetra fulgida]
LLQGNDLIGVKRHVSRENATDENLDIANISCYHHITNTLFDNIFTAPTITQQNNISKEY